MSTTTNSGLPTKEDIEWKYKRIIAGIYFGHWLRAIELNQLELAVTCQEKLKEMGVIAEFRPVVFKEFKP
jgi:hypothetical protein